MTDEASEAGVEISDCLKVESELSMAVKSQVGNSCSLHTVHPFIHHVVILKYLSAVTQSSQKS